MSSLMVRYQVAWLLVLRFV